jgi:hypothetical protein
MSKQINRLRKLEEQLLTSTHNWNRKKWLDFYEEEYKLSQETFNADLTDYNHLLNEHHNPMYDPSDKKTIKETKIAYCNYDRSKGRYVLIKNASGVYYTYFNHSQRFFQNDLNQLEYLIDSNRSFFDQNFVNLFKVFKDNEDRKSEPLGWDPVLLNKVTPMGNDNSFGIFLKAIRNKQPLEITYADLHNNNHLKTKRIFPMMLREYTNGWITGWYLLSVEIEGTPKQLNLKLNKIRVFALDRITAVKQLDYYPEVIFEEGFNPADYFKYTIGISRSNLVQIVENKRVVLETISKESIWIYDYLKKYPFHPTQKILEDNREMRYLKFSIQVEENWELEQFLLKYATDIRVVNPLSIKSKIEGMLRDGSYYYS